MPIFSAMVLHRRDRWPPPRRSSSAPRRLAGDLLGLVGVVGVLLDVGRHLLHRRRRLLGRRCLFGGALRKLLGVADNSWLPEDTLSAAPRLGHHGAQLVEHPLQRDAERVAVRPPLGGYGQVAAGDRFSHVGGRPQICRHAVQRIHQIAHLVAAGDNERLAEVAIRHRIRQRPGALQPPADAERDPSAGADGDQQYRQPPNISMNCAFSYCRCAAVSASTTNF